MVNDVVGNVVTNPHPVGDRLKPRFALGDQSHGPDRLSSFAVVDDSVGLVRNGKTVCSIANFGPMGFQPIVLYRPIGDEQHDDVTMAVGITAPYLLAIDLCRKWVWPNIF